MERPFIFIETKTTERTEFFITSGRQPTYALFYVKKGNFSIKLGDNDYLIGKGDCVILSDDIDFSRKVIEPISFFYLKFRINPKCTFLPQIPIGPISFKNKGRFIDSIEKYEGIAKDKDAKNIYYGEHLLEDILLQAFAENQPQSDAIPPDISDPRRYRDPVIRSTVRYVFDHISERITVETLCQACNTNPSTLNFKMRKELSVSTGAFVEDIRMEMARKLLKDTTYKIREVAQRCGYENIYYFSTVFTKHHGISPNNYRKQYR